MNRWPCRRCHRCHRRRVLSTRQSLQQRPRAVAGWGCRKRVGCRHGKVDTDNTMPNLPRGGRRLWGLRLWVNAQNIQKEKEQKEKDRHAEWTPQTAAKTTTTTSSSSSSPQDATITKDSDPSEPQLDKWDCPSRPPTSCFRPCLPAPNSFPLRSPLA